MPGLTTPLNQLDRRPAQTWVRVMLIFSLVGAIETLGFGQLGAFTPLYLEELKVPLRDIPFWTGVLTAVSFAIGIPLAPFWGVWADKYGRKLIIARSAYLEAVFFLGVALSANLWQLGLSRMIVGFVLGNTGVMLAAQSSITPRRHVGLALSIVAMGNGLGIALGPLLGGLLVGHVGFRALFEIDAALSLLSGLLITFGYREDRSVARSTEAVATMLRKSIADIVRVRWLAALFLAYFALLLGSRALQPFVPIFIKDIYRHGPNFGDLPQSIGVSVTLSASAVALFAPVWGRLGDRFGYYRMLMAAAVGVAAALLAQSFASDLPSYLVPAIAMGAFAAAVQGLFFAIIALGVPDDRRASVLNLAFLPFYLAGLLAPSLGTLLLFLGLRNLFRVSAALMLVALGLLAASRRLSPRAIGK